MTSIRHCVIVGLVALAVPLMAAQPAAAQAPEWIHDLADDIARNVERQAEIIARNVERQAEQFSRIIERQIEARQARRPGRGGRGPELTEPFTRTVRLGRTGTVDLQNVSGEIVVTGGGGDDVRIDATKRVRHPNDAEARTILSELTIQVEERSGRVEIRTTYPRRRNWSGGVDFMVTVPREAGVTLRSVSGAIRVSNVNGEIRAESISGDITTESGRRVRQAKTVSGNVQITNGQAEELTVGSVSGDVVVNRLRAARIEGQTVSGDLRLTDVDTDRATLRSVSGDLEYAGSLSRSGRYEFQSHSGDVRLTPADARGFSVEATTFSGDVRSDFPLTLQTTPGNGFGPGRRNRSLRGSFGDAGATLSVQSFSGDIVITRR
jgi:DUF4097 and DUF4098 domain-containing protein YvlB